MRIVLVFVLAAVACDKGGDKAGGGGAAMVAAWQKAGLTVSAMTPDKTGAIGDDCTAGTISGVDVVLCTFASAGDAKAAEAKGYAWVGATTGTALVRDTVVLAVADRRAADPSGKTINAIAKTFRGR